MRAITNPSVANIVTSVLAIYWTYVYYTYWKVINGMTKDAIATHPDSEGGKEAV
ncbi:hypothetical protein BCR44DRAFT_1504353 [Catenaria anguillulae PL171]|uniref:Uncharacterized protein n=1 Tax=Catenaria anguillulae PL171 TaxID=765915 RepID=A0A1Y2HAP5_9FUNG|nr:hypothetical protein BCR44DRAFT_1504353 [Catenaria anguillulae PL171]